MTTLLRCGMRWNTDFPYYFHIIANFEQNLKNLHPRRMESYTLPLAQAAKPATSQPGKMEETVASQTQPAQIQPARILVLGIGNVLWADEGFGVRCIEHLAENWALPDTVHLMDGGTQGLYLLPFLEEADALIVFDAVDYGLTPGTMKIVENDQVPAFMGAKKMSLHQTGFQDVIATAQLMGYCPAQMLLIGVQPVELEDYGGGLRPLTAAQIDPAVQIALNRLRDWGVDVQPGRTATGDLADPSITRDAYEAGRPSEAEACRTGDDRFFPVKA